MIENSLFLLLQVIKSNISNIIYSSTFNQEFKKIQTPFIWRLGRCLYTISLFFVQTRNIISIKINKNIFTNVTVSYSLLLIEYILLNHIESSLSKTQQVAGETFKRCLSMSLPVNGRAQKETYLLNHLLKKGVHDFCLNNISSMRFMKKQ